MAADDEIAQEAGFDVELYAKEKLKRQRMADAKEAIEAELELRTSDSARTLHEGGGIKVIDTGLGNAIIVAEDGDKITPTPVSHAMAKKLFERLTGKAKSAKS
jgi:hypothetical protein